ncbi:MULTISPECIES: PP2C family protein-serine/threonine phosphatase [Giesbergeria]|uniref:PP2C family protein-serine/threonine phosphatase n=1 Tax=Giesbergeria sinuosa TaxID=80883 RepID=A0ABV9Q8Q1_9BURK
MQRPLDSLWASRAARLALRLFAPAIWLSGRLTFSRKYLLIGIVVLLAMASLSMPLWQQARQARETADTERAGLRAFAAQAEVLAQMVQLRDQAVRGTTLTSLPQVTQALTPLAPPPLATPDGPWAQLHNRWQQVQQLDSSATPQRRFAVLNGAINAMLGVVQSSARVYRLNVDPELDATFELLTSRLPLVLDTLGKQQDALTLNTGDMASYALGAQVVLTESMPGLKAGVAQLMAHHPTASAVPTPLEALLVGIVAQQDAADKTLDNPDALDELRQLAHNNQQRARELLQALTHTADAHLLERITRLKHTQWTIAALLVGALAAIAYLFVGIYLSTLHSLRSLSKGTDAFCAGRLDTRIQIDTQDELVLVARNFNTVAGEFGRLLDVIREQNESRERELETQVQARTAELAEKNEQLRAVGDRVQEELNLARAMQLAILPQQFPDEASWAVHAIMFPARELGGDFYDGFMLPDGRYGILVADVSGKGVGAAFFMAVSRTVLLDLAMTGQPPHQVLAQANDLLCERNPMDLFVTACYGIFDPRDGSLSYASAGHHPPLLRQAHGEVQVLPSVHDLALAVFPDMRYLDQHITLAPGDTLVLYTDGVTEAFSPANEAYGDARLHHWLVQAQPEQGPAALVAALVRDVEQFVNGAEASDDLTCLILCRK